MKNFLSLIAILPQLMAAQTTWPNLVVSPANPKPGETIRIEYAWTKGPLAQSGNVEVIAFDYAADEPAGKEISWKNEDDKLVGTFITSPQAIIAYVGFQGDERWDNNGGQGYFIPLYDASGKPMAESKAAQALISRSYAYDLELNVKSDAILDLLQQAFTQKAALRKHARYFSAYIGTYLKVNRNSPEARAEALRQLAEAEADPKADDKLLSTVADFYNQLAPDKSKALKDKIIATYPNSALARFAALNPINAEPDLSKRKNMLDEYVRSHPPQNDMEKSRIQNAYLGIMNAAADVKNWEMMSSVAPLVSREGKASTYNNIAWELAEKNEELDRMKQLSAEATEWARMEMAAPSESKPALNTYKDWENGRRFTYAMFADTYAFILDKTGDTKSAAKLQGEAVEIHKGGNAEFNERYIGYLERAGAPNLRHRLEGFILQGSATANMKEMFKKLYVAEDKSDTGASAYLARLEETARAHLKEELMKKMIDEAAPGFTLKNLQGEQVSLENLRGKVVVVDFWATWCGPCKASFPGMQMAVDKYKSDPNVTFVFVDTWENGDNKEKNAADFINGKGYTFNVLMDNENKVVASYGVSGIPTKFIVDKKGKIRFKSIGYAGSSDALVDELSLMIEAAKAQP